MKSFRSSFKVASCVVLFLVLIGTIAQAGTNRYVSLSGSETPPYTNWTTATRSIQKAVDASVDGDIICVATGKYMLTNHIVISKGITVSGADTLTTIVNGNYPVVTNRCFYLNNSNAIVENLTITNGYFPDRWYLNNGGGVYMDSGSTIRNCIVAGNRINGMYGAGIFMKNGSKVYNSTITGNSNLDNTYGLAGGIYIESEGVVSNCLISNNNGGSGAGGVEIRSGLLSNCRIIGNRGGGWGGGGVTASGGGYIRNCILMQNESADGGGIYLLNDHGSPVVENCTIVGNRAIGYGQPGGTGGGIYFSYAATNLIVRNTIIWSNVNYYVMDNYGGKSTNITYSCTTPLPLSGTGNISSNPLFVSWTAKDYHLSSNSPCIAKGANLPWMEGATDLDGNPRIAGSSVDMGAYERNTTIYISTNGNDTTGNGSSNAPYATIQKGIDIAVNGDDVLVKKGIFSGLGNRGLIVNGKNIDIVSESGPLETIIDCGGVARGIVFSGAFSNCLFGGFTINNGYYNEGGDWGNGGIIRVNYLAAPIIDRCIIQSNTVVSSSSTAQAGLISLITEAPAIVRNCLIINNSVSGGTYSGGGYGALVNSDGGSRPLTNYLVNCTLANNTIAGNVRASIYFFRGNIVNVIDCDNLGAQALSPTVGVAFYYCTLSQTLTAPGITSNNPSFIGGGNYCLQAGSPAINTGTNMGWILGVNDLQMNERIVDSFVDIGAYEYLNSTSVVLILTDRASVSVPEGGTTNFQVKLSMKPAYDTVVVVARASGDTDITPTAGTTVTFTTNTWAAYQTVTLSAAEDNGDNSNGVALITCSAIGVTQAVVTATEADDDLTLAITTVNGAVAKNPDTSYYDRGTSVWLTATANVGYRFTGWFAGAAGTANPVSLSMTSNTSVTANFSPNVITVQTDSASVTVPEGSVTNFQVKLSAQPTGTVSVTVARTAGDADIAVSGGGTLSFTTANWGDWQTVTLSAAEDPADNSNGVATITCSGAGITNATVQATEADDDYVIGVSALHGTISKNPESTYYDRGLSVELAAIHDPGFHFIGWSGAATGTNNPINFVVSNNISVTATFILNIVNIVTDHAAISIPEGGSTNFHVKLSAQPPSSTVVSIARTAGDTDISVPSGSNLTFTTENWGTYQAVTLVAAEDDGDNANGNATITLSGPSMPNVTVQANEIDDDYPLIVTALNGSVIKIPSTPYYDMGSSVSLTAIQDAGYHFVDWSGDATGTNNPVSLTMDADKSVTADFVLNVITVLTDRASLSAPEGGSTNFQVKLSAQPTGDTVIVVAWTAGDIDITPTAGTNLTFMTNTWDIYQAVTLAAAEDNGDDLAGIATITCSGTGITNAMVTATEIDDDYTLDITAVNGSVAKTPDATLYDSGTTVSLEATQNAGYHFTGWSGDAVGTTNPISMVVDEDKDVTASFVLNVITVLTDRASILVPEGGSTNFQFKLSAQPTGDVVVAVGRTTGDTDISVSEGANLTFSPANWADYQTVTLAAAEDNTDNANGTATITCDGTGLIGATVEATEIDDEYTLTVTVANGSVAKNPDLPLYDSGMGVALTATESAGYHFTSWTGDVAGTSNPVTVVMTGNKDVTANFALNVITVLTDRASVTVPEGATAEFQVKLSAQPTGATVVAVGRTTGDADITVAGGASLTFSTANWSSYQTVTLAAAEDNGDNQDGSATITCSSVDISNAVVEATEADDDYVLTVTSLYGTVTLAPDTPYYDNGTLVTLTANLDLAYYWKGYSGDLTDTNNPAAITMDSDKSVTAEYGPTAPNVLPPSKIAKKSFTARWMWVEGGAPEGEISVILQVDGFPEYVPGYWNRNIYNVSECLVTNLLAGKDYWYRVRRLMPDGSRSAWSSDMKVRTGKGIPVFKNLLSDGPVSKGISQEFAISNLVSGVGTLGVKSSNTNSVKATVSAGALTLQYLWKTADAAKVTLTLTHPASGYKASYGANVSRAGGSLAILSQSALTNAGAVVAQEITLENRTGGTVYGIRVRALGLNQQDWLINRTGLDPISKAAIREIPCVLPAGGQMVVRLVYNIAYKKQAKTDPVAYGAWAIMTPVHGAMPVTGEMTIIKQDLYDGLWLLGVPANRNRLYTVYHSDDDGATWTLNVPVIRATANYLMWLDMDEGAPAGRLYRVVDAGM